jgi:hypothetical protein
VTPGLIAPHEAVTAAWLAAVRNVDFGAGVSLDLWFECFDGDGSWTHVCHLRGGRAVDWLPTEGSRPSIVHDRTVMDEALGGHGDPLDPRWRCVAQAHGNHRRLPPLDLLEMEVDVSSLPVAADLAMSWATICLVPNCGDVGMIAELGRGTVRHRLLEGPPPQGMTVLTMPAVDHLKLRSGGAVMAAFDDGGAEGDLDELLFLAGLLDSAPWRSAAGLADATVWRVHDHFRMFGVLRAPQVDG